MITIGAYFYGMVADLGDTVEIQRLGEPDATIIIITRQFFNTIQKPAFQNAPPSVFIN